MPLLPKDLLERQQVRAICEHVNCGMQPLQNLRTCKAVMKLGADKLEWCLRWNKTGNPPFLQHQNYLKPTMYYKNPFFNL